MNSRTVWGVRSLVTFAAVYTFGTIGFMVPSVGRHPTVPVLVSGISAAACIRWGREMWPAVFLAAVAVALGLHRPVLAPLGVGLGTVGAAVSTAWMLERGGFDPGFGRARDVPMFIFAAAIGTMLVPTLGLLGFFLAGEQTAVSGPLRWIRWWSNSAAGVVLVGPMLVALSRQSLAQFVKHWSEGVLWLLVVVACCAAVLSLDPNGIGRPVIMMFALLLSVVACIRFGFVVAAFGALVISVAVDLGFASGHGAFGHMDEYLGLTTIWTLGTALTGMCLIITALLAERDRAGLERLRAEQRYAQIFDGSPQPLWVHDADTLEFLLVNEAAVRQYGWTTEEFLAQRVTACACCRLAWRRVPMRHLNRSKPGTRNAMVACWPSRYGRAPSTSGGGR